MWKTFGHSNQKKIFERILETKSYSHAYLFSGPKAVGKKTLALEFARKIIGVEAESHPDLIVWGESKYKIEDVRQLISDLSLKPFSSEYKVAVLDNFENITEEAANSILKTLEEPNPSTIIILVTSNKKALLPTILSRVQAVHFHRLTEDEMTKFKDVQSIADNVVVGGRPGRVMTFSEQGTALKFVGYSKELSDIESSGISHRLLCVKKYSELENEDLTEVIEHWIDVERHELKAKPHKYKNLQLLIEALAGLKKNLNKKMALEKLFLGLS